MLWNASSLREYLVVASGDEEGTVKDFIFDEHSWSIAWLGVETGSWLSHQQLYLPVSAFGQPVAQTKTITLKRTSAELAGSPTGDIDQLGVGFRSLAAIGKATVEGTDETVGQVQDFLIESADWQVKYLVINPSGVLSDEKVLMPARAVTAMDFDKMALSVGVTRQFVKDGPHYDPKQTADGAYEESFLTYYGIRFVKK